MRNPFKKTVMSPMALATRDALQSLVASGARSVVIIVSDGEKSNVAAAGVDGGPKGLAQFVAMRLPHAKDLIVRGKLDQRGGN